MLSVAGATEICVSIAVANAAWFDDDSASVSSAATTRVRGILKVGGGGAAGTSRRAGMYAPPREDLPSASLPSRASFDVVGYRRQQLAEGGEAPAEDDGAGGLGGAAAAVSIHEPDQPDTPGGSTPFSRLLGSAARGFGLRSGFFGSPTAVGSEARDVFRWRPSSVGGDHGGAPGGGGAGDVGGGGGGLGRRGSSVRRTPTAPELQAITILAASKSSGEPRQEHSGGAATPSTAYVRPQMRSMAEGWAAGGGGGGAAAAGGSSFGHRSSSSAFSSSIVSASGGDIAAVWPQLLQQQHGPIRVCISSRDSLARRTISLLLMLQAVCVHSAVHVDSSRSLLLLRGMFPSGTLHVCGRPGLVRVEARFIFAVFGGAGGELRQPRS